MKTEFISDVKINGYRIAQPDYKWSVCIPAGGNFFIHF